MSCDKIKEWFADYLVGDLDDKPLAEVQAHLAACPSCRQELESLSAIWTKLGVIPQEQPSSHLRQRFYSMLEAYKEGMEKEKARARLGQVLSRLVERFMPRRPVYQLALSLLLLAIGLGGGYLLNSPARSAATNEISTLHQEVHDMRQTVALSLLKQASPSDRLMGVSWTSRLRTPDEKTIGALLETLNSDPSVSVRLAAVDALYLFYNHPQVRESLIASVAGQSSPLVQLSLINLLVELRERRAVDALQQLIQNQKLNPKVRKLAEMGLAQLS